MIIELLLDFLFNLFSTLTTPIDIPSMPDSITTYFNEFVYYISMGLGILNNFVNLQYMAVLFGVIIGIDVGIVVYHFVLWIIKKIPMAGVS